ncbi:Zinc transporter 2 [Lamellibrachia satsuma]|nr:Zinc transporter 2 [Lamellibrachia satsuma]
MASISNTKGQRKANQNANIVDDARSDEKAPPDSQIFSRRNAIDVPTIREPQVMQRFLVNSGYSSNQHERMGAFNSSKVVDYPGTHCHKERDHSIDKRARRKLIFASILCLLFMLGEVVGGIMANSLAIATDAAHMMTDFAGFMISLLSIYLSSRRPTKRMSFGWHRAEVMGALISVLLIWVVTGVLVYLAVLRVIQAQYEINATVMLITAAVGVVVNIILGLNLSDYDVTGQSDPIPTVGKISKNLRKVSQGQRKVSQGQRKVSLTSSLSRRVRPTSGSSEVVTQPDLLTSDGATHRPDQPLVVIEETQDKRTNINVRAAFIHVLGDLCQSLGVVTASIIIYYKPEWKLADPICTFLFSVLVLVTTITILKDIVLVLMEGTPKGISYNEVKECLQNIEGAKEVHNLRIWALTMDKTAVSVHVALDKSARLQVSLAEAGRVLREKFNVYECTIQMERYVDEMLQCSQCQEDCG